MPASSYHQYHDPETGETRWLPQLFPHSNSTGGISSRDLETWVKTGVIPKDLYEDHEKSHQKMEEIHNKLKNGEEIAISELPHKPWALTEYLLKNKARLYGENILQKIFSNLDSSDPDIVWLSCVKEALTSIASEDPLTIHFYVARKTLKDKYEIDDPRAVDILARSIVEHCRKILNTFQSFNHPAFKKAIVDLKDIQDHIENSSGGIMQLDADFIRYLKCLGHKGKKLSSIIDKNSKEIFEFYKNGSYADSYRNNVWGLWVIDPADKEKKESVFLELISQASWEDECENLWNRKISGHPSLAKPIIDRLIPILGPKKSKKFAEKEGNIICYDPKGEPLFMAPAVDVNMISAFQNGVKELGTLTGHKMLRWQVNTGFEKWQDGNNDPRLIEIDGGYSRIAELTGCNSPKEIAKIRDILHAQAYGHFIFPDGSHGNMITLRIDDRHRNHEPSKIRIVLGDMLLPAYVCQLQRSERRLIPIGPLPPLQGSPNSHASQAQLQLHVFSEFSNQSDRLAQSGSVLIPLDRWQQMAQDSGLNPDKIEHVINYWCQPDLFNCFLEKQGDEYRLASFYEKAHKFLEIQGKGRIINRERGLRSVENRRKK